MGIENPARSDSPLGLPGAFWAFVDPHRGKCHTRAMNSVPVSVIDDFLDAIVLRDFSRMQGLLAQDIDFRAMTPNRIWEAEHPADVREVLRGWFEHPQREVESIAPVEPSSVADTLRVGWRVRGQGADGPFLYEQQAYVREQNGLIVWLRIMCSGPRPMGRDS